MYNANFDGETAWGNLRLVRRIAKYINYNSSRQYEDKFQPSHVQLRRWRVFKRVYPTVV
jgi:hypothetical protein